MLLTVLSERIASNQHPLSQPRRSLVPKRARNMRAFFLAKPQLFGTKVKTAVFT